MKKPPFNIVPVIACALFTALGACGGGGGQILSGPAPITPQPGPATGSSPPIPSEPPLISPVSLLQDPASQEYSTFNLGDPFRIRYDAARGVYEVDLAQSGWKTVVDDPLNRIPGYLLLDGEPREAGGLVTFTSHDSPSAQFRYQYSSLINWRGREQAGNAPSGTSAFGAATMAASVPTSGIANHTGRLQGTASVPAFSGWGDQPSAPIEGTVSLSIDFSNGKLAGQIDPYLACDCLPQTFPKVSFEAVLAPGSSSHAGQFLTDVTGPNTIAGLLTGPVAQESIASFTAPFAHQGRPETMTGVWITKRD